MKNRWNECFCSLDFIDTIIILFAGKVLVIEGQFIKNSNHRGPNIASLMYRKPEGDFGTQSFWVL